MLTANYSTITAAKKTISKILAVQAQILHK